MTTPWPESARAAARLNCDRYSVSPANAGSVDGLRLAYKLRLAIAEIERLEAEKADTLRFMDGVREEARNRNPKGATILDFMAVWNEQYEKRIADLRSQLDAARSDNGVLQQCHANCVEALAQVAAICRATENDVPGDAVAAARITRRQFDATNYELVRTRNALKEIGDECHAWRKLLNDTERALGMETVAVDPSARSVVERADEMKRKIKRLNALVIRWGNGDLPTDAEWAAAILAAKGASDGQAG